MKKPIKDQDIVGAGPRVRPTRPTIYLSSSFIIHHTLFSFVQPVQPVQQVQLVRPISIFKKKTQKNKKQQKEKKK